jgi:hypothetical protein
MAYDVPQPPDDRSSSSGGPNPAQGFPPPPPAYPPGYPPTGGYPPPAYGYPPPGYGGYQRAPATSGKATAILVLGIVGLVLMCGYGIGLIPAIVALCLAPGARRELEAAGGALTGDGFIRAGVICSWVAVGVTVAGIVLIGVFIAIAAAGSSYQ